MSGIFSGPSTPPAPPMPPPPPTVMDQGEKMDAAAAEESLRLQRGRASTLLTGGQGTNMPSTSKALFGQ